VNNTKTESIKKLEMYFIIVHIFLLLKCGKMKQNAKDAKEIPRFYGKYYTCGSLLKKIQ